MKHTMISSHHTVMTLRSCTTCSIFVTLLLRLSFSTARSHYSIKLRDDIDFVYNSQTVAFYLIEPLAKHRFKEKFSLVNTAMTASGLNI